VDLRVPKWPSRQKPLIELRSICVGERDITRARNGVHGLDLRRRNALSLWAERDRSGLQTALEESRRRPEPLVALADLQSDAGAMAMEVLYAPLAGPDGAADRFLGLYQPLGLTARLRGGAITAMSLRTLRRADGADEAAPRLRLATLHGRRIA